MHFIWDHVAALSRWPPDLASTLLSIKHNELQYTVFVTLLMLHMVHVQCRSLGTMSVLFGQIVRAMSSGGRVMEFMNIKPSVGLHGGQKIDKNSIRGEVVFKDVTFSYPSRKDQVPPMYNVYT